MFRPIPRDQWPAFCDSFTRRHQGWLVDLEVYPPAPPRAGAAAPEPLELEREQPLQGVTAELHKDRDDEVVVIVGAPAADHLDHVVHDARALTLEQDDRGADAALRIESASAGVTCIRFRATALPEEVNGA